MAGRLQNEDHRTEAEITGAGGAASQLLNDTKVWLTTKSKRLDTAITDGDLSGVGPSASQDSYNLSLDYGVSAGALTISLKDGAGADPSVGSPVTIGVRNPTITNGLYNSRTVTSALSLTCTAGAALGHKTNIANAIYVYLIDSDGSGAIKMGVCTRVLDEARLHSTTAMSAAASQPYILYSDAAYTNKPVRLIGRLISYRASLSSWASSAEITSIATMPFERYWDIQSTQSLATFSDIVDPTSGVETNPIEGTQTFACEQPGLYRLTMIAEAVNSNIYTLERYRWNLGGSATRRDGSFQFWHYGIAAEASDVSSTDVALFEVTSAGQTITVLPGFTVTYTLTGHTFRSSFLVERISE